MFDDCKIGQPLVYNFLLAVVKNNKIHHAYLFDTRNLINKKDFALSFSKFLVCKMHYTNKDNCGKCDICTQINAGNYAEIKMIEPDGLWIKKEQIAELQIEFSTKPIDGNKKIFAAS